MHLDRGRLSSQHFCVQADALLCATYLTSSNVDNTQFYEACGFKTVAEITLGEGNPDWKEPPVIVQYVGKINTISAEMLMQLTTDGEGAANY